MKSRRHRALVVAPAVLVGGVALGTWMWRRWGYRVDAREREVAYVPDGPVPESTASPSASGADVQKVADGVGPRFHRRYRVEVAESTLTPQALMAQVTADIQAFVPDEIAVFKKVAGDPGRLAEGDEFHIAIKAPWDGPVRVIESAPTRFTLATLAGHMEAGQIRFQAAEHPRQSGALRFTIESWARSADDAVDWFYDTAGVAKAGQQAMWTFFCQRVADACGGQTMGDVTVRTEREADDA